LFASIPSTHNRATRDSRRHMPTQMSLHQANAAYRHQIDREGGSLRQSVFGQLARHMSSDALSSSSSFSERHPPFPRPLTSSVTSASAINHVPRNSYGWRPLSRDASFFSARSDASSLASFRYGQQSMELPVRPYEAHPSARVESRWPNVPQWRLDMPLRPALRAAHDDERREGYRWKHGSWRPRPLACAPGVFP
jgi:hypothetical protein